jgi:F0F1-type ATP synthase assembly protein I
MLKMGLQVAVAIGVPLLIGAFGGTAIDERLGTRPWGLLVGIILALVVGTMGLVTILRQFLAQPLAAPTDRARTAGRNWDAEIREDERRREAGEEELP